jgi:hypothetical protein
MPSDDFSSLPIGAAVTYPISGANAVAGIAHFLSPDQILQLPPRVSFLLQCSEGGGSSEPNSADDDL